MGRQGRPIDNTAKWFPYEKGFRNSPKMKALRHYYGITGVAIYLFIWEYLLECEYQRVPYTDETLDIWTIDFEVEVETLRKVIECCLKYKMFQIDSQNNIYSEDLNSKLAPLFIKRNNDRERFNNSRSENSNSRSENSKLNNKKENNSSRSENGISRSENSNSRSENGNSRSENSISRSELKIQYTNTSTMHSSSADIRAREGEEAEELANEEQPEIGDGVADEVAEEDDVKHATNLAAEVDAEVNALLLDVEWKIEVFERFKFLNSDEKALKDNLLRWAGEVRMRNRGHTDLTDAKDHFKNWLIRQEDKFNPNLYRNGTDNNNGYRTSEDIYAGAASIISKLRSEGTAKYTTPLPEV